MTKLGLYVALEAQPGKEAELAAFLKSGAAAGRGGACDDGVVRAADGTDDFRHFRRFRR